MDARICSRMVVQSSRFLAPIYTSDLRGVLPADEALGEEVVDGVIPVRLYGDGAESYSCFANILS